MRSTSGPATAMSPAETPASSNFIRRIVEEDLRSGHHQKVVTRFPPEPNGYLHIGHAKAICLDFGLAQEFGGRCHLRFDDTNPEKEEELYARSIMEDVRWLGFDWGEHLYHASDYFEQLYEWAVHLVREGKAYVDEQSAEEIRTARGTLTEPGRDSPWRDRPAAESLALLEKMRRGELGEGACVLRAKIDMAHPNLNMRDPVIYRIKKVPHPRTGDRWCIYPTYDFAHGQSDAIEHITHSLCTLEFENHRPLYDWFLDNLPVPSRPRQIEFNRLNLSYTVLSKRKLKELVDGGHVEGWDDPRMPTLSGLRRRGVPPEAIREFCERIGYTKVDGIVDMAVLEHCIREVLNRSAERRMAVLRPLRLVIENWPDGEVDEIEAVNNPEDPSAGTRRLPFSGELWIEEDDFREEAPRKYFRLKPGQEVRLKYGYYVTCTGYEKDESGRVILVRCTYDPESRGGGTPDNRKVRGTLHWVSAAHAVQAEVRLLDRLFRTPDPDRAPEGGSFLDNLNPHSLETVRAWLEPSLATPQPGRPYQFERLGYFTADPAASRPGEPVFLRTVGLKDSWAKIAAREKGAGARG